MKKKTIFLRAPLQWSYGLHEGASASIWLSLQSRCRDTEVLVSRPPGKDNGRFLTEQLTTEPPLPPRWRDRPRTPIPAGPGRWGRAHGTAAAAGRSGSGRGKVSPVLAPFLPLHTDTHTHAPLPLQADEGHF